MNTNVTVTAGMVGLAIAAMVVTYSPSAAVAHGSDMMGGTRMPMHDDERMPMRASGSERDGDYRDHHMMNGGYGHMMGGGYGHMMGGGYGHMGHMMGGGYGHMGWMMSGDGLELDENAARDIAAASLALSGKKLLTVGAVKKDGDDAFIVDVVTRAEKALADRLRVDRASGQVRPVR